jgi:hypothetical protein
MVADRAADIAGGTVEGKVAGTAADRAAGWAGTGEGRAGIRREALPRGKAVEVGKPAMERMVPPIVARNVEARERAAAARVVAGENIRNKAWERRRSQGYLSMLLRKFAAYLFDPGPNW